MARPRKNNTQITFNINRRVVDKIRSLPRKPDRAIEQFLAKLTKTDLKKENVIHSLINDKERHEALAKSAKEKFAFHNTRAKDIDDEIKELDQ